MRLKDINSIKHQIILFLFVTLTLTSYSQKNNIINRLNGIWIAEDFSNVFDTTRSITKSKYAFDPTDIVGLRFNSADTLKDILYGDFYMLHNHVIDFEESYKINNSDTILPFCIEVNTQRNFYPDSLLIKVKCFFEDTTNIHTIYFVNDTTIIIHKISNGDENPMDKIVTNIKYKKIENKFDSLFPQPNAIYYYIRSKALVGTYVLKDKNNKLLSANLKFNINGSISGYAPFTGLFYEFLTDIYCGPEIFDDIVLFYANIDNKPEIRYRYAYKRKTDNIIELYKYSFDINKKSGATKKAYILERK